VTRTADSRTAAGTIGFIYRAISRLGSSGRWFFTATRPVRWSRRINNTQRQQPNKGLLVNGDGSVDVYFGPTASAGEENNWVQTFPSKGWNVILRLYGPLDPWFDKTWRPGEIEETRVGARALQ
jgi:hypothetical protein